MKDSYLSIFLETNEISEISIQMEWLILVNLHIDDLTSGRRTDKQESLFVSNPTTARFKLLLERTHSQSNSLLVIREQSNF